MRRSGGFGDSTQVEDRLVRAHRLIMEAADGPGTALLKGRASRAKLGESISKLRHAISLMEAVEKIEC